ncbi:hypothetical protein MTR_3g087420 [Medicago truncatula]|uniref:Uncharacterized protein n=1 Tax=Medicago truncatula TaxID=3880 RepID=G7J3T9_MEDTR|nr:hypothetical protein MTR_3g087420 [Medicago truncatula]
MKPKEALETYPSNSENNFFFFFVFVYHDGYAPPKTPLYLTKLVFQHFFNFIPT